MISKRQKMQKTRQNVHFEYEKRLLLICIHHFYSDGSENSPEPNISGLGEFSTVALLGPLAFDWTKLPYAQLGNGAYNIRPQWGLFSI